MCLFTVTQPTLFFLPTLNNFIVFNVFGHCPADFGVFATVTFVLVFFCFVCQKSIYYHSHTDKRVCIEIGVYP